MSKKVTSVKTHYPDVIQKFTWDVAGAMLGAGMSVEGVEKFQSLLQRAYNMGHRGGYEKAEQEGEYYVEATRRYSQQIDRLKEFLAETFGWEMECDEWDEEYEERAYAEQEGQEEDEWERHTSASVSAMLAWQEEQNQRREDNHVDLPSGV